MVMRGRVWAFGMALVAAVGVFAAPAHAAPPPSFDDLYLAFPGTSTSFPGLSGVGSIDELHIDCSPDGTQSTVTFKVSGVAQGSYPGTFTEQGSWRIVHPPSQQFEDGSYLAIGVLVAYDAVFRSEGSGYVITGQKTLPQPQTFVGSADCIHSNSTPDPEDDATLSTFNDPVNKLAWTATIAGPTGTFSDHGTSDLSAGLINRGPGGQDRVGPFEEHFYPALEGPSPLGATAVTVSPPSAVNPVGTSHTVTATAINGTSPATGARVLFQVSGSTTANGSCTTNQSGQCAFSYAGPDLPGADLITACADNNQNGVVDPAEPCGSATKAWLLPTTTDGHVTGGGQAPNATHTGSIAFGFNAKSDKKGVKGECDVVDLTANLKIKCTDVTTLVQSGTHATLFGPATVNGFATTYRIDIDDLGEPGRGRDTFRIHTASGYAAGGVITDGNIQVH
jgi:hypothetical protein